MEIILRLSLVSGAGTPIELNPTLRSLLDATKRKHMTTTHYLQKKYGFSDDASISADAISEELLITPLEARDLAKSTLGRERRPGRINFSEFCKIVSSGI